MKIVVTVGCSNSGKSTWSHNQWKENPYTTLIVNRDNIRALLFGFTESTIKEYYERKDISQLEKQVTLYEDTLIHDGLNQGKTVIVDATHLKTAYLKRFEFFNVPIEYVKFDEPLEILLERNSKRLRQVPEEVIQKQFNQLRNLNVPSNFLPIIFENKCTTETEGGCYIIDIDGTVAEKGDRNPFDWKRVGSDMPILSIIDLVETLAFMGDNIIFCSGRDESCRADTIKWLDDNFYNMSYDLYMRPEGDTRPDWVVKEEMWRTIAKKHYINAVVDDRNQVVRRARALGLKVLQVEYGNF